MKGALGGLEHGLADILLRVIDIAINDDARLLPECQHGIVAERDLVPSTPVRSSSLPLDKRPKDHRDDSVAGDDLSVDDAHRRGIIGRLGNDREADHEK